MMWAFVLSLFAPHLSFFYCLGKAVRRDCVISGYFYNFLGAVAKTPPDLTYHI